jgi:hypothetical protein
VGATTATTGKFTTIEGTDTTDASSTTTAALKTAGGLAVVKKIYVGDNIVIGTSGKGIDFSATPGTGTSELLADYEEGTWSPVCSSNIGAITSYTATGVYTKIGRIVNIQVDIQITAVGTGGGGLNFSLPFTQSGTVYAIGVGREDATSGVIMQISTSAADGTFFNSTNAGGVGAGYRQRGSLTYITS